LEEVAKRTLLSVDAINRFELEMTAPRKLTLTALQRTFEDGGVIFKDEDGHECVCLRKTTQAPDA